MAEAESQPHSLLLTTSDTNTTTKLTTSIESITKTTFIKRPTSLPLGK